MPTCKALQTTSAFETARTLTTLTAAPMTPRVQIPAHTYAGYIFDLDGTLVDSMPTHYRAWRMALANHGCPPHIFRWAEFNAHGGMAAHDIVADLNRQHGLSMPHRVVADEKRANYAHLLRTTTLPIIPETVELVRTLRSRGIPCAIGTGSALSGALATLESAGISHLFDIIITPDDVPPGCGKPRPDIFLLAAQRMGVPPTKCIVFEDAEPGLRAAQSAGMASARVAPVPPPAEEN